METDMTTDMRTDIELRCDVLDEMDDEAMLADHRIVVAVKNGLVFLMGQVESFTQKSAAERAAYQATGRRAMATGLSIKRYLRSRVAQPAATPGQQVCRRRQRTDPSDPDVSVTAN